MRKNSSFNSVIIIIIDYKVCCMWVTWLSSNVLC